MNHTDAEKLLPNNWREIQRDMLLGTTDAASIRLVPFPDQVWQVDGHRHSEGSDAGDDIATIAWDEADARFRLVEVIRQDHHKCMCATCVAARAGKFPDEAKLKRIR